MKQGVLFASSASEKPSPKPSLPVVRERLRWLKYCQEQTNLVFNDEERVLATLKIRCRCGSEMWLYRLGNYFAKGFHAYQVACAFRLRCLKETGYSPCAEESYPVPPATTSEEAVRGYEVYRALTQ